MKNKKISIIKILAVVPSFIIIASALAVVFKIFDLPPKVEANTAKIIELEKDNVATEIQLRYHTELLTEMRADIKRLLMMKKID